MSTKGGSVILRIYFALVSFVTLMMLVFSVSDLINVGLKTYVFKMADAPEWPMYCEAQFIKENVKETAEETEMRCSRQKEQEAQSAIVRKQQSLVRDISMLIVSLPLFFVHFRIVLRDWKEMKKEV
mgnify:CR=1 FL=1